MCGAYAACERCRSPDVAPPDGTLPMSTLLPGAPLRGPRGGRPEVRGCGATIVELGEPDEASEIESADAHHADMWRSCVLHQPAYATLHSSFSLSSRMKEKLRKQDEQERLGKSSGVSL